MLTIIPRIDLETGDPILFFSGELEHNGNAMCYAHVGQHSEASRDYYLTETRPADPLAPDVKALIVEWLRQPPVTQAAVIGKRMQWFGTKRR